MSMTNCDKCNRSVLTDKIILHRINEKGIPGIFRCDDCLTEEQKAKVDPETQRICEIIRDDNP